MASTFHVYFGVNGMTGSPKLRRLKPADCFAALAEDFDDALETKARTGGEGGEEKDMREAFANMQFSRRRVLISLIGSAPFAALSVGAATASPKVAQSAAHYQPTPNEGQACAGCYLFVAPNHCKFLAGEISPSGWCRLWKAKEDQDERHA